MNNLDFGNNNPARAQENKAGSKQALPAWVYFLLSICLVIIAALLRNLLFPVLHEVPYVIFFLPITISSLYGGFWPGLLAAFLAGMFASIRIRPGIPVYFDMPGNWPGMFVFLAANIINAGICARLRNSKFALIKSHDELEKRILERTVELTNERQRMFTVLETLPVYVVLLSEDYRVPFANKFFRDRFGESRGRRCYEYLFNRNGPCDTCETYKVMKTNAPHHWEWLGPDRRNYDIYDFPFIDANGSRLIMEMGIDITEQKKAQEELVQTQKEIERSRRLSDIGTLAATVAHELRNPLAAIKMAAYNAQRKSKNPILDKHFSNIEIKLRESENIIDNLLFYSKIRVPHFAPINIHNIFSACLKDAILRFPEQRISVIRNDTSIKNLLVEADAVQVKEIFANLLNNSFDAMGQESSLIEIRAETDGRNVRIGVKDNGAGINKENLEMIFQAFFTTKAKGTGLGLTVVQQIIKLHGGSINLESQEGKGTTVTIILPIKQNQNA